MEEKPKINQLPLEEQAKAALQKIKESKIPLEIAFTALFKTNLALIDFNKQLETALNTTLDDNNEIKNDMLKLKKVMIEEKKEIEAIKLKSIKLTETSQQGLEHLNQAKENFFTLYTSEPGKLAKQSLQLTEEVQHRTEQVVNLNERCCFLEDKAQELTRENYCLKEKNAYLEQVCNDLTNLQLKKDTILKKEIAELKRLNKEYQETLIATELHIKGLNTLDREKITIATEKLAAVGISHATSVKELTFFPTKKEIATSETYKNKAGEDNEVVLKTSK